MAEFDNATTVHELRRIDPHRSFCTWYLLVAVYHLLPNDQRRPQFDARKLLPESRGMVPVFFASREINDATWGFHDSGVLRSLPSTVVDQAANRSDRIRDDLCLA